MLGAPGGPSLGEQTLGYCLACLGPPPDSGTLWWWPATLPRELSAPSLWPWATCWLAFLVPLTDSTSWSSRPEEGAFTTRRILPTGTETHSPTCNRLPGEAGVCVCLCTPVLSASQERALWGLLFINRGGCGSLVISKGRQTTLSPFHHTGKQIERDSEIGRASCRERV